MKTTQDLVDRLFVYLETTENISVDTRTQVIRQILEIKRFELDTIIAAKDPPPDTEVLRTIPIVLTRDE